MAFVFGILLNVASGLLLAGILFWMRDHPFAPANVSGSWYAVLTTDKSAYRPFLEMKRTYRVLVVSDGKNVSGTAEIVHEESTARNQLLVGRQRVRAAVDGKVVHRIFAPDRVALHVTETGKIRTSSAVLEFEVPARLRAAEGRFWSTAGDQEGTVKIQREPMKSRVPRSISRAT